MNFYALNIAYAFICLFIYVSFRMGIGSYLRYKKNSKTFIRKNKNGFLNYWTYKKLHKEINLGYVYYLNLILVILTPIYFLVAISFGWSDLMRLPIGILNLVLICPQAISMVFSEIYHNYEYHKRPFVILAKNNGARGFKSSLFNYGCILATVAFAIYIFVLSLQ